MHNLKRLGNKVEKDENLAEIGDLFGQVLDTVNDTRAGIIIGQQNTPLVQEGEAMFHIAHFKNENDNVAEHIKNMQDNLLSDSEKI